MSRAGFNYYDTYAGSYSSWDGPGDYEQVAPTKVVGEAPSVREVTSAQFSGSGKAFNSMYDWGSSYGRQGYIPGRGNYSMPVSIRDSLWNFNGDDWSQPEPFRYSTYRIMDRNPTIRLAYRMITARILSSSWTIKGESSETPKKWIDFIESTVRRLRYTYLQQALRYLSFGWRPFELLWELNEGMYRVCNVKPLMPDITKVIVDTGGNFVGLAQSLDDTRLYTRDFKAFKVTNDGEANDHYGISRHDAAYDPWLSWQKSRMNQLKLSNKLAGIVPILKYPPGVSVMEGGAEVDNSIVAQDILDNLSQSTGVAMQGHTWERNELVRNPNLTKVSDWEIDFYDAGTLAPAQMGMISTCEYDDKLILRAWETPERSAVESVNSGSRADSESHTNTAVSDSEVVDADLARQFSDKGPIDMMLLLNFGKAAVGKVFAEPAPLVDRRRAAAFQFLKLLTVDPVIRLALTKATDINQLLDLVEVPRHEDFSIPEDALNGAMSPASGSGNPTGGGTSVMNKGASTGMSINNRGVVVGRPVGSVAASQRHRRSGKKNTAKRDLVQFKDIKDDLVELLKGVISGS